MNHQIESSLPTPLLNLANSLNFNASELQSILLNNIMPAGKQVTNEQFISFVSVASDYGLNPLTKEIYAFPAKGGGIQPIVSIDGWLKIINSHNEFDGMEFSDNVDSNGALISITCRIFRKDRNRPTEMTEYMSECRRGTDTWKNWPTRMLRHKATIQAARYAFGLSGIIDPDEAERFDDVVVEKEINPQTDIVKAAQAKEIIDLIENDETLTKKLLAAYKINAIEALPSDKFEQCISRVRSFKNKGIA